MALRTCEHCGKEFKTYSRTARFCSRSCKAKNQNEQRGCASSEKVCPVCGKSFRAKNTNNIRCSRECYASTRRSAIPKPKPEPKPPRIKVCGVCGAAFVAKTSAKFCQSCREPVRLQKAREYWKTEAYKEAHRRVAVRWQKSNPEKYKAQSLAKSHPGKLSILYECPCVAETKHYHHPDYTKPFDVLKLCPKCHAAEHSRLSSQAAQSAAI